LAFPPRLYLGQVYLNCSAALCTSCSGTFLLLRLGRLIRGSVGVWLSEHFATWAWLGVVLQKLCRLSQPSCCSWYQQSGRGQLEHRALPPLGIISGMKITWGKSHGEKPWLLFFAFWIRAQAATPHR